MPTELGDLKCLQKLCINDCPNLEDLPPSIGNIGRSLQEVSFSGCDRMEHFPPEISNWKNLRLLEISSDNKDHAIDFFCKFSTNFDRPLQEMKINIYHDLECLPPEFCKLRYLQKLRISNCDHLNHFCPEIGHLEFLQELEIKSCHSLQSLPTEIGNLKKLRKLVITESNMPLQSIPLEMRNLESLQELEMPYCGCLERLSLVIYNLKGLRAMDIEYNPGYGPLKDHIVPKSSARPNLRFWSTLEYFSIRDVYVIQDLNEFLQSIAAEPSESSPISLLLPRSIRHFDFRRVALKKLDIDAILKILQKYPKLGKIQPFPPRKGIPSFSTVDMLHLMYFNRFGRSLQVEMSTFGDDNFPTLFDEKLWPMVLEEAQKSIRKDIAKVGDKNISPRLLSASIIYSIVQEALRPLLLE